MGNENSKSKETAKNENGSANGLSANLTSNGLEVSMNGETILDHNGEALSLKLPTGSTEPEFVIVESDSHPAKAQVILEIPEPAIQEEAVKKIKEEKVRLFGKMFKKKSGASADIKKAKKKETSNEDETDVSPAAADPQPETANQKQESQSLTEPESVTPDPEPEEEKAPGTDDGASQPAEIQEESDPEENPVMNFFKSLVTPTKTSKKETATPDATKEQSQKETQPAAATTAAQISEQPAAPKGMSIPPPPPPEPPKMEVKGEPAAKPVKLTAKEEPKAAAKEPEPSKSGSAIDSLSKFFGLKETPVEVPEPLVELQTENKGEPQDTAKEVAQPVVEEQVVDGAPQPVVEAEKADPSKAGTLEAAAKPPPPPPAQEEKKTASKSSFFSLFKSKSADPKKASSAPAAAAAEAAQGVKAKEEPKPGAKSSEGVVDSKQASVASQAGDDAASVPRKLEKRNSIQLFFKNLGQKRHSTDAGVQTEPVTVAPAAEKAK
ncbi:breast carcinoma-amplified sequence 1 isoform X1 [Echeneis naucrates]|uniref:breast carcinoma-amplified sequence 1 isoform X1 n=1 Tax=Echeneis naucrates TaxID=173247 RepID=UPI001113ECE6|nr:proteoglycan 4-like isoform X1 [Echeneis naucrates]